MEQKKVLLVGVDWLGREQYVETTETPTAYHAYFGFVKKSSMWYDGIIYRVASDEDIKKYQKKIYISDIKAETQAIHSMAAELQNLQKVLSEDRSGVLQIDNESLAESIEDLIANTKELLERNPYE